MDFDRGLNKAVLHLREALGGSAEEPQFIQTLPRKGYRFIGKVELPQPKEEKTDTVLAAPDRPRSTGKYMKVAAILLSVAGILLGANVGGARDFLLTPFRPSPLQITSLAVLPLEDLSGDPGQAYFADGMTDALITEVARAGTIHVISRTTVLRYKSSRMTTRQIGHDLNVGALVEGTVLHSGNKVRITAQLIQVSTDDHLWARSYERDATEVLQLQQEVATDIARRIGSVVTAVEPLRTVNPEAPMENISKDASTFFSTHRTDGGKQLSTMIGPTGRPKLRAGVRGAGAILPRSLGMEFAALRWWPGKGQSDCEEGAANGSGPSERTPGDGRGIRPGVGP